MVKHGEDNKGFDEPVTQQPRWGTSAPALPTSLEDLAINNPISPISDIAQALSIPPPLDRDIWQKLDKGWIPRIRLVFSLFAFILAWVYLFVGFMLFFSRGESENGEMCPFFFEGVYKLYTYFLGCLVSAEDAMICEAFKKCKQAEPCCDGDGCCPDVCGPCARCIKKIRDALRCIKRCLTCQWLWCCKCKKWDCECECLDIFCQIFWTVIYTAWYIGAKVMTDVLKKQWKDYKNKADEKCYEVIIGKSDLLLGLSIAIFVCKAILYGLNIIVWVKKKCDEENVKSVNSNPNNNVNQQPKPIV